MEAAHPLPTPDPTGRSHSSERKCLVTGEVRPKNELLRFVVSPDQRITPDLAQNLPGRGLWVTADRDCIAKAASKNLFSRAAKTTVKCDPYLADQVARLMRKRCLEFLGLARRAGIAVLGQPQVETALKAKKLDILLLADDAGTDLLPSPRGRGWGRGGDTGIGVTDLRTVNENTQLHSPLPNPPRKGEGIPAPLAATPFVTRSFTRNELGAALGHDQIVYAGLKPHPLTEKLAAELARLDKIAEAPHISPEENEKK